MGENSRQYFNLVDEPWIPVATYGRASLREIFASGRIKALGGNPRQKIALLKLLLAIGQAAATPEDDEEWQDLGENGMVEKCLDYLEEWHDKFWLYGPEPFLQMPLQKAAVFPFGIVQPEIAMGNNSRFMHMQCERPLDDADKALLLITHLSMCLGGKGGKGDNKFCFSKGVEKKSAPAGPAMGFMGYLHSFLAGSSLRQSIWFNLFSEHDIANSLQYLYNGKGTPPWERMPTGEEDEIAENLKYSLMGKLVPMARFCLLDGNGLRFTQGITHPTHKEGMWDPTVSVNSNGKDNKMLWTDPEKRPWRSLAARLAFLSAVPSASNFNCAQLSIGISRLKNSEIENFSIYSAGMRVSSNAGEQYLTGADDMLESETLLNNNVINNENWHLRLITEMAWLEHVAKIVYAATLGYSKDTSRKGKEGKTSDYLAKSASGYFWEMGEQFFPDLLAACQEPGLSSAIRLRYKNIAMNAYDMFCDADTPKHIAAWARHRPKISTVSKEEKARKKAESLSLLPG